jgi:hypothetical protein
VPLISEANRQATLDQAGVSEETATAILEVNQQARLDRLRASLVRLAGVALLVLFSARRIPNPWPPAGRFMVATGCILWPPSLGSDYGTYYKLE